MRRLMRCCVFGAVWACGCTTPLPSDLPAGPPSVGVYSEFLDYETVKGSLATLAAWKATLKLAVPPEMVGRDELADLLRAADSAGVPVSIWLTLDHDDGYWGSEYNVDLLTGEVRRLVDWMEAEALTADSVVFNLEPSFDFTEAFRAALDQGIPAVVQFVVQSLDPLAYEAAREKLTESVRDVQSRGLRAVCVTYPQVIDDVLDDNDNIQDAMGVPVRGVPFDEVAFMVYQTSFGDIFDLWLGPALLRSYAADAKAKFGDRAVIILGQLGTAARFPPRGPVYTNPSELAEDVAAVRAEGINRIEIYSLDGMLLLGGPDLWLSATVTPPERPGGSVAIDVIRLATAAVDALMDRYAHSAQ